MPLLVVSLTLLMMLPHSLSIMVKSLPLTDNGIDVTVVTVAFGCVVIAIDDNPDVTATNAFTTCVVDGVIVVVSDDDDWANVQFVDGNDSMYDSSVSGSERVRK